MTAPETSTRPLVFVHIGDLHVTDARRRNFRDFMSILAQIEIECGGSVDFVVLPGDNADDGRTSQYRLVATALKMLSAPVHVIPGDHDMEQCGLDAFYAELGADRLPKGVTAQGVRCLFLDICGPGGGGPDFRIGSDQLSWLDQELRRARERGQAIAVFVHAYPADLKGEGERETLNRLIETHEVALIDMGHTHYNELANNGRTIFAATRSTGQIEEGPVGYSIVTIDAGVVSWRFKALDDPFPFVVIVSPADHRLLRDPGQRVAGGCRVRAVVFGARRIERVRCEIAGSWTDMAFEDDEGVWTVDVPVPDEALFTVTVRAVDESGRPGQYTIRAATRAYDPPTRKCDGSDADSIGAWPENGIAGTQLGPNRNAPPFR